MSDQQHQDMVPVVLRVVAMGRAWAVPVRLQYAPCRPCSRCGDHFVPHRRFLPRCARCEGVVNGRRLPEHRTP